MQRQASFAEVEYGAKKKQTRRDKFLADMETVVPWARLEVLIEPKYPSTGRVGRQPIGIVRMLRMYCLQQWYGLADEAVEDAFYDSQALRGFAGIVLNRDPIPAATTVLHFRHWLEQHELTKGLFDEISAMLEERGLLMCQSLPRRRPGGRSSMPRLLLPRPRPRTRTRLATRRCIRPRRATPGTSG